MYLFIINPKSGNGNAVSLWNEVEEKIKHNFNYKAIISNSEEETRNFITEQQKINNIKTVALIGGDGTVSSIIQEIACTDISLAIFPTGSGNDTARTFRLTADPDNFIKGLLNHRTTRIDLLKIDGRFGLTVAGVGIDAAIGNQANHAFYKPILNKLRLGSTTYTITAILALLTFKPFKAVLTIDGEIHSLDNVWLTTIGNTSSYGGGLEVCPTAVPTDGILNITMLNGVGRLTVLFRSFPALLKGRPIQGKGVTYKTGKKIIIHSDRDVPAIVDGEIIQSPPLTISVQEKALTLVLTT